MTDPSLEAVLYCDSSALVRAYLDDEGGHADLARRLLDPRRLVVTSAVTEVEIAAAIRGAARRGRLAAAGRVTAEVVADMGPDGHIELVALDPARVHPRARELCEGHRLRALDAIHLAVALNERDVIAGDEGLIFVTRGADQAAAARAEGLAVA